jgi:cytochrome o ubiquinol oxidase subunit II
VGMSRTLKRLGCWATLAFIPCVTAGCTGILDPQGPVGAAEKLIILNSLGIMLAIVIPTILATLGVAWWFRSSNTRALYRPDWEYSGRIELVVWAIPAMVVILRGGIGWVGSHDLDPKKPLPATAKPIEVQVVSLDWKWLFIYPEQGIASVNRLVVPAGVPVHLQLTSATVMNSFFVPQLGSQIYTMAGMTTQLNLQADKPGDYFGLSAQFSGDGFSGMHFSYDAVGQSQFEDWLAKAKSQGQTLDLAGYTKLAQQSANVAPYTYHDVTQGLFAMVLRLTAHSKEMRTFSHAASPISAEMER